MHPWRFLGHCVTVTRGGGQHIDLALLDTHAAWLINVGMNYLTSGEAPLRYGNGHANIVPYQPYPASDGYFILTIGNNVQFRKFCDFAEIPEIPDDPRFAENQDRVKNRDALEAIIVVPPPSIQSPLAGRFKKLGVPCGREYRSEVFEDPQIRHREMEISMDHPLTGDSKMKMIGNPILTRKRRFPTEILHPCWGSIIVKSSRIGLDLKMSRSKDFPKTRCFKKAGWSHKRIC